MQRLCWLALLWLPLTALAVVDGHKYPFDDAEKAERFRQLAEDLRCPKCQNQNLADSNAPVAVDLRDKVYELLQEDQSDEQIVDYLVARYGDFVRYNPPFRLDTLLLWIGPLLAMLFGIGLLVLIRRGQNAAPKPLTDAEKAQLEQLKKANRS
ncbi:cytochrome c-type biogenesis protein CcmH [Bacterioplanes sanyensis]|uniref:Cytochrome c-type biogenesis protein n=2 Tax=Bacterioplanes sanyensis TaxID=1249553 RepID=A0A222FRE2_9GAMM|nr:cytochrome c-type biogenesis protein CcmH [Bacterioplanes sanyensis]